MLFITTKLSCYVVPTWYFMLVWANYTYSYLGSVDCALIKYFAQPAFFLGNIILKSFVLRKKNTNQNSFFSCNIQFLYFFSSSKPQWTNASLYGFLFLDVLLRQLFITALIDLISKSFLSGLTGCIYIVYYKKQNLKIELKFEVSSATC